MRMLDRLLVRATQSFVMKTRRDKPAMEPVYQYLVARDLARLGIEDDFYPVGFAASYGLFYAILRIAQEYKPRNVLDVGAGQSSVLWSRLREKGFVGNVVTL